MTSEILIMNRDAVVMAADSAVTINDRKTHNGANKLFELSKKPPMAMMIFGTLEFGSVSFESLIMDYKEQTDFDQLGNILKVRENFINYLNNVKYDISDFDYKLEVFKNMVINETGHKSGNGFSKDLGDYEDMEILPFLENNPSLDIELENMRDELGDADIGIDDLRKCFNEMLLDSSTGVVIAGFDKNNFKPSYLSFELITKYGDDMIISNSEYHINSGGNFIIPFAQSDVTNTFISGIDDEFMNFM